MMMAVLTFCFVALPGVNIWSGQGTFSTYTPEVSWHGRSLKAATPSPLLDYDRNPRTTNTLQPYALGQTTTKQLAGALPPRPVSR